MGKVIDQERFTQELFDILDEIFETHHGYFLDKGTSLLETLMTISATEASNPVGRDCASLAVQVKHIIFQLEVLEGHLMLKDMSHVDWSEIWRTVKAVTPDEWVTLQGQLKQAYQRVVRLLRSQKNWDNQDVIAGALTIAIHTAYHLGEIRQALCTLRK